MNAVAYEVVQVKLVEMDFGECIPTEQTIVQMTLNNRLDNLVSNIIDGVDDKMV